VLTISVITIEVSLMAAIFLHGEKPTLARDPMFATLMIVLNGMVGTAHMGAMRYSKGARSFLAVIALLAVFALIMPDLTKNRTRSEPIALPSRAARRHHHSFLCHLPHHPERAAPILLRRTVQRQGETVAYLVATRHGHSGHSGITCIAAVLAIGTWTGYEVHLGLDRVDAALLVLTLFVSALTFGGVSSSCGAPCIFSCSRSIRADLQPLVLRGSWP
jgi:Ca2+/H+ antiporter